MISLSKSRYRVRLAESAADVAAAQRLRYLAFIAARGGRRDGETDCDRFDARCRHVLVEDRRDGRLVCCFRLLPLQDAGEIRETYAAQYYELSALTGFAGRMAEMGRFCIRPGSRDPEILRAAWGALALYVQREEIDLLFGCSSFTGTEAGAYAEAFALLSERHLAPRRLWPRVKAPEVVRFARRLTGRRADPIRALRAMPPLLRSYLAMGGWVSDHAVVDRDLDTMHVFTGLEIRKVPPARVRRLRALES